MTVQNNFAKAGDSAQLLRALGRSRARGLYVHVPFCFHKCHYCDFYSVVADREQHDLFARRLIGEMRAVAPLLAGPIETIFVGGGTPTLLAAAVWQELLAALRAEFDCSRLTEFTVEANPETVEPELIAALAQGGVNRLSLGAQSFSPRLLNVLRRWHEPENVTRAAAVARAAGIENIGLDLIFGVPGETLADWQADLDAALALSPAHLSCYALAYEPGTGLAHDRALRQVTPLDEDLEAAMYESTIVRLTAGGFEHYEISSFARPGRRCRHNLLYWEGENWLGLGPAAASHVNGVRWKNAADLEHYLASSGSPPIVEVERLAPDAAFGEALMLRLRLVEGIPFAWLDPRLDARRRDAIARHLDGGLLERTATHLRLSRRGLLLANTVFADLI